MHLISYTILRYIKRKCREYLLYAEISGQKHIEISFRGLYRYYTPSKKYPRFMDVINEAIKNKHGFEVSIGLKIDLERESIFMPIEKIKRICIEGEGLNRDDH